MATSVLILTEVGFGKTTSIYKNEELGIEGLNPTETALINVKDKPLTFVGWRRVYGKKISEGGNYAATTDAATIITILEHININRLDIHNVVIDDAQYIMAEQFMADALKTGYEKFSKLAKNMYDVINKCLKLRSDIKVFILAHQEETKDSYCMKTIGKMLTEKVSLEGLFTIMMFGSIQVGEDKQIKKYFITGNDGKYPARTPHKMFDKLYIPNDLGYIAKKIDEYENGEAV